jgi:hypothetical protein
MSHCPIGSLNGHDELLILIYLRNCFKKKIINHSLTQSHRNYSIAEDMTIIFPLTKFTILVNIVA